MSECGKSYQGADIHAIRMRTLIERANVVVHFGKQHQQWNAALDVG